MQNKLSFYNAKGPSVMIVGSVAYDTIHTPFETGERILGGSASYASLAASYFAPVQLVGVVGHDFLESDQQRLKDHGIDLTGLQVDPSGKTFFWEGRYHANFNRRDTIDLQLNVFERFEPKLPDTYRKAPYVLLGTIHPALQAHVLDQLIDRSKAFVWADTIQIWIEQTREAFTALVKRIDGLIINDDEAERFTGKSNVIEAGQQLLNDFPLTAVIIKKGEHGACLFHRDGRFLLPAYPVTELRDPTGAGDSFAGALLGFLAARGCHDFNTLKAAMFYATVTASMTVEAFSCNRLETAGAEAIQSRCDELKQMTQLS
jgi:sugar/nucleoside kinase (ribokinase family)